MSWQRVRTVPANGIASAAVRCGGTWVFRTSHRVFAWQDGAQLAWQHELGDEQSGQRLLAATDRVAVVASVRGPEPRTDFVALELATGAVVWQRSRPFLPANRRNTRSLACDGAVVTCLGSDVDRRFSMLRLDAATGDVIDERVLDTRYDAALAVPGRTFAGGAGGLVALDGDRLEPILAATVVELEPFGADLLVHTNDGSLASLAWLTAAGTTRARVVLAPGLGVVRPTAASAGRVVVMPQLEAGLSLYDLASGAPVWTAGRSQGWEGHRAVVEAGRMLVHIDRPGAGLGVVGLDEATGAMLPSPVDQIGSLQLFGGDGRFLLSMLLQLDVYRWT